MKTKYIALTEKSKASKVSWWQFLEGKVHNCQECISFWHFQSTCFSFRKKKCSTARNVNVSDIFSQHSY